MNRQICKTIFSFCQISQTVKFICYVRLPRVSERVRRRPDRFWSLSRCCASPGAPGGGCVVWLMVALQFTEGAGFLRQCKSWPLLSFKKMKSWSLPFSKINAHRYNSLACLCLPPKKIRAQMSWSCEKWCSFYWTDETSTQHEEKEQIKCDIIHSSHRLSTLNSARAQITTLEAKFLTIHLSTTCTPFHSCNLLDLVLILVSLI